MGRLTRALLIAGGMYVAYHLGEITGFIKGAKGVIDATSKSSKELDAEIDETIERVNKLNEETDQIIQQGITLEKSIGTEAYTKLRDLVDIERFERVESVVDLTSGNLDMLRGKVEDLEERIKILDSAFNYHIMDDNRHKIYGGN